MEGGYTDAYEAVGGLTSGHAIGTLVASIDDAVSVPQLPYASLALTNAKARETLHLQTRTAVSVHLVVAVY